jgi:hypothetical protein
MNESKIDLTDRLRREGRWAEASKFKDTALVDFRASGMKRDEAGVAAWAATAEAYPPLPVAAADPPEAGVSGLGDLPADWPVLPANATLQADVSWVIANRLLVRDGDRVDLARALAPAPSYAALSWLETSILFPAKFADISVKATSQQADEHEHVQRERLAIDEIRSLLAEMVDDDSSLSV